MTEFTFHCSPERFNRKISKYLTSVLGEPKINRKEAQKVESISYSSPKDNIDVNISVLSDVYAKKGKYLLRNRVEILFKTNYQYIHSSIVEKLEKLCRN